MLGVLAITIFIRSPLSIAVRLRALPLNHAYKLMLATLLQIVLITVIYVIELKSVDPGIHVSQAIVYSGAANFALFVSITPGAIGFREAFLVFSQNLHHVPASTILTANVIDRSAYVLLLGVLFVVAVSLHVQKRYAVSDSDK